jgi:hypothetical protein
MVDVLVENILDPTRYKDWEFTFWLPEGSPVLESMDSVEYDVEGTVIDVGVVPSIPAKESERINSEPAPSPASSFEAAI